MGGEDVGTLRGNAEAGRPGHGCVDVVWSMAEVLDHGTRSVMV